MDLKTMILESFQATSLLLVFVTLLFTLRYSSIMKDIHQETPAGELEMAREKKRLLSSFFKNLLPIILISGSTTYLFLPLAFKVFSGSELKLWDFDFVYTAYTFIVAWVGLLFLWSLTLGFRLLKKAV